MVSIKLVLSPIATRVEEIKMLGIENINVTLSLAASQSRAEIGNPLMIQSDLPSIEIALAVEVLIDTIQPNR